MNTMIKRKQSLSWDEAATPQVTVVEAPSWVVEQHLQQEKQEEQEKEV
jgi:hypothetical protein